MNIKKIIACFAACCIAGTAMQLNSATFMDSAIEASAADSTEGTYESLTYEKYSDHIEITLCNKSAMEVMIPAEIDGLPVTNIGGGAFAGCSGLTSITIPDSVTNIGGGAFWTTPWIDAKQKENPLVIINNILIDGKTCEGDVVIPDKVTSISGGAFEVCSGLTEITVLNPNCEIYDDSYTICNGYDGYKPYFNGTIHGYENSTAQAYAEKYGYNFEALRETGIPEVKSGDANGDGEISVADATLVLQYCGNKDKYQLSEQGLINADVDGTAGISAMDALKIQQYDAGVINSF